MLLEVQGADLRRSASGFRPRRIVSFYARVSLTFEKLKLHDISAPRPADRTWSVDGTGRIGVGIGVGIKRALLHILALGSQRIAGAQGVVLGFTFGSAMWFYQSSVSRATTNSLNSKYSQRSLVYK